MKIFLLTDKGCVRSENQDRFFLKKYNDQSVLFAVADGVGGYQGGEIAAQTAVDAAACFKPVSNDKLIEDQFSELIFKAHNNIEKIAADNTKLKNMGSTIAIAYINSKKLYWAHVGDTRIYLVRNSSLKALTYDHTMPGVLLCQGEISSEQARTHPMSHGLLKCLGGKDAKPDYGKLDIKENDIVFACSDGLHSMIPNITMEKTIADTINKDSIEKRLVQKALANGGQDNITIAGVKG